MIICPNEKIVFMNIPKTGTRSVLAFFEEQYKEVIQLGHRTDSPKLYLSEDYFRFATIRNPYDRIASHYWAMMRRGNDRYGYIGAASRMKLDTSLESYLILTLDDYKNSKKGRPRKTGHPFSPQIAYIEDNKVDQIIHMEKIDEEFNTLPFITHQVTLPHANATSRPSIKNPDYIPRPPWNELVGEVEAEMINDLCAEDFAAFSEYEKI